MRTDIPLALYGRYRNGLKMPGIKQNAGTGLYGLCSKKCRKHVDKCRPSPEKSFFLATLRTSTNYYTLITKTLINIRNTFATYIATWYTVSHNVRNVGNVARKKLFSGHGIKTEL